VGGFCLPIQWTFAVLQPIYDLKIEPTVELENKVDCMKRVVLQVIWNLINFYQLINFLNHSFQE
jgi:hypothetical protein